MTAQAVFHLFVYGTLRRGAGGRMQRLLARHATYEETACFRGRLLDAGGYPGMVATVRARDAVRGDLYRLRGDGGALLRKLDRYEACGPGFRAPCEYRRVCMIVTTRSGRRVPAWVYLYNRPAARLRRIRHVDYLRWHRDR